MSSVDLDWHHRASMGDRVIGMQSKVAGGFAVYNERSKL